MLLIVKGEEVDNYLDVREVTVKDNQIIYYNERFYTAQPHYINLDTVREASVQTPTGVSWIKSE